MPALYRPMIPPTHLLDQRMIQHSAAELGAISLPSHRTRKPPERI